jgi:spore coat protein H
LILSDMSERLRLFATRHVFSLCSLLLCALAVQAAQSGAASPGAELFTNGALRVIQITIPPEAMAELRANSRKNVAATVREGTNVFERTGVHLKGSVGSFRKLDDKPAFTLSFDKFTPQLRFHGLRRIHLNNSVEDASYMNELLGSEIFRQAGVPAARVAHARVELNGRPLGLYVLKEGFTEDFLAIHFRHPAGNLYEPGRGHDVDELLEKQLGDDADDRSDLEALATAAQEPDAGRRWQRLRGILDVDRFLTFMALEISIGHRDGYCLARNNFRVYHDVDSGRLMFLPHGMDQLFGSARVPIEPRMNGLVARAVMETPPGRQEYRQRCSFLLTNVLLLPALSARVDAAIASLRPALSAAELTGIGREVAALKERIAQRLLSVEQQLQEAPLEPLRFENGFAALTNWRVFDAPAGGSLAQTNTVDLKRLLTIEAGPVTFASWRSKVLLPRGRYRFEGALRTEAVTPLGFGKNHGAALRVAGLPTSREHRLIGTQPWKTTPVTFEVTNLLQEVELMCELRAMRGQASFDLDSLRIRRLE